MRDISMWVLANDGYETVPGLREHLSGYMREHPGIKIFAKVRTPASLWEDLFRIIKNPHHQPRPDIVQIPSHWTSTLAHLGLFQDLAELDSHLDLRRWFPPVQDNCRLEGSGRIYSLPWWMVLRSLFYSRDSLREAGIVPESLENWAGFQTACRTLAASGIRQPIANPNPRGSVTMSDLAPSIWSRGGDFFSADGSRSLFQREDTVRAIGDYFELLDEGWMPVKGQSGPGSKNLFEDGCVFQLSGRLPRPGAARGGRMDVWRELPKGIGVVGFPPSGRKSAAMLRVANLAMLRDIETPREVYALLSELVRDTSAAGYARSIGSLPTTETELARSLDMVPEFREVFRKAMGSMRTFPNFRVFGTLEKVFNRSMERLVGDVLHKDFGPELLKRELIHAAAEIDYVLSLYG